MSQIMGSSVLSHPDIIGWLSHGLFFFIEVLHSNTNQDPLFLRLTLWVPFVKTLVHSEQPKKTQPWLEPVFDEDEMNPGLSQPKFQFWIWHERRFSTWNFIMNCRIIMKKLRNDGKKFGTSYTQLFVVAVWGTYSAEWGGFSPTRWFICIIL